MGIGRGCSLFFVLAEDRRMTSVILEALFCKPWRVSTARKPFAMLASVMSIFSLTSLVVLACWKLEIAIVVCKTSSFCEIARGDCICHLVYCVIISVGIERGCSMVFVLAGYTVTSVILQATYCDPRHGSTTRML